MNTLYHYSHADTSSNPNIEDEAQEVEEADNTFEKIEETPTKEKKKCVNYMKDPYTCLGTGEGKYAPYCSECYHRMQKKLRSDIRKEQKQLEALLEFVIFMENAQEGKRQLQAKKEMLSSRLQNIEPIRLSFKSKLPRPATKFLSSVPNKSRVPQTQSQQPPQVPPSTGVFKSLIQQTQQMPTVAPQPQAVMFPLPTKLTDPNPFVVAADHMEIV